jgi:hypothetical protein
MKQIRVYFFMAAVIKGTLLFLKEFHFFVLPPHVHTATRRHIRTL